MGRSRRKRFVVTYIHKNTGETKVREVLLHPRADGTAPVFWVRELAEPRWAITSILPKTHARKASTNTSGWQVDEDALAQALIEMKIKHPVRIKQTSHPAGRFAAHGVRAASQAPRGIRLPEGTQTYHHITVKSWLSVDEAGKALYHELAHAMQAERVIRNYLLYHPHASPVDQRGAWYAYEGRTRSTPYEERPIEIEAREYEALNTLNPLAIEAL